MFKRPELLAPVGRLDSFYAAIENGANAVYVGGKQFSARAFAHNLDLNELKEIVEYAKLRNIKVYITVNTLVKNNEMDEFVLYLHQLSKIGVDAIIVQDFGVARIVRQYFPAMNLHASTQMSAHSQYDVSFLKKSGYKRVVLARELTLEEIETIKQAVEIEIETFVHGALCVSYSGQCLMSSIIGGRSGNRGRCAQPCRLPYALTQDGIELTDEYSPYLLSPKDIETLDLIPKLIDSGIDTFKIEGRMKGPDYIASVARIYNKYINMALENTEYKVSQEDKDELLTVFNRGGFSHGYYTEKPGKAMMASHSPKNIGLRIGHVVAYNKSGSVQIKSNKKLNPGDGIGILTQDQKNVGIGISKEVQKGDVFTTVIKGKISEGDPVYLSKNHQLSNELTKSYAKNTRKSLISIHLKVKLGEPIALALIHEKGSRVSVFGDVVVKAKNAPISREKLYSQISRFGNSPFEAKDIRLQSDDNVFVSISSLNKLRRDASQALMAEILSDNPYDGTGYKHYLEDKTLQAYQEARDKTFSASVRTMDQLEVCLDFVSDLYWELDSQKLSEIKQAVGLCHNKRVRLYMALPHIQRDKDYILYDQIMNEIETTAIDGYVIRTYGQFEKLINSGKEKIIDYTMNVFNNENIKHWESYGVNVITLSAELNADELGEMTGKCLEMIVYGHLPIMTTEQCLVGRYGQCPVEGTALSGDYTLKDRKEELYPLLMNCKMCRMQILSSKPIMLGNRMGQLQKLPIHRLRFLFNTENAQQIKEIISCYRDEAGQQPADYTNRYFTKGVE